MGLAASQAALSQALRLAHGIASTANFWFSETRLGGIVDVEGFISRWTAGEGGAERANYQMFLSELCDVLGVARPDPAGAQRDLNDYVFERAVRPRESGPTKNPKRIDLYKRDTFILEAKQSRLPGKKNAIPGQQLNLLNEPAELGRRSIARDWDVMMQNARRQAEGYVFLLDVHHKVPPFLIICDVGHCFEIYADFTGTGRAYGQFPDRKGFRIFMEELRTPEVRELLSTIWTDPYSLDPAKESARVTQDIARRLAQVSKALEADNKPEAVANFLMRCLFTMFAEDVDLLPVDAFKNMLIKSVDDPTHFKHRLQSLWRQMQTGEEFSHVIEARVRHFNGGLFKDTTVFDLGREEIGELLAAARHKWTDVDPAIFGTLLEQALDKQERKKLGAHYTPRNYVQLLVDATVMGPLRLDWQAALTKAEQAKEDKDDKRAITIVRAFHRRLCDTRVLDPACGTGNFLYVSLELMKRLEGEVLETLARLGEPESLGLDRDTVDPHQFLGLELNTRAAAIAELVVWIGYLQQHYRTRTGHPSEPILRAFKNINFGKREEGYDAVLAWDGCPAVNKEQTYTHPHKPQWPEAEFIVGNPPFVTASDFRTEFGDNYAKALWKAHPEVNESADFVLYWWDRAATILNAKKSVLRRFGFVSTNSVSQVLQRRVMEAHLNAKNPISLVFAVPDHPWVKGKEFAAVRIAMTACEAGTKAGTLWETVSETGLNTDDPVVTFSHWNGIINSDLTVGPDVTKAKELRATRGIAHDGVKLHGSGFILKPLVAEHLGLGRIDGLDQFIRPYRNGRDFAGRSRGLYIADLFGLTEAQVRQRFPDLYQHLLTHVRYDLDNEGKPKVNKKGQKTGREWNNRPTYKNNWWIFGEPRAELRPALVGIERCIATVDTAKHRIFQFVPVNIIMDDKLVIIADDDAATLAILSSRIHVTWSARSGGWLGQGNDPVYTKTRTFDPFPFPVINGRLRETLRAAAGELDDTRKKVLADNPDLRLTGIYDALEAVRSGRVMTDKEKDVAQRGRALILRELHSQIDQLTASAYEWAVDLTDNEILEKLIALNADRMKEESSGEIRWLRPAYQIPLFARGAVTKTGELDLVEAITESDTSSPLFPTDRYEQPLAIEAMLLSAGRPMDAAELARSFRRGGKRIEQRVTQVLTTLSRYGRVMAVEGDKFDARKVA